MFQYLQASHPHKPPALHVEVESAALIGPTSEMLITLMVAPTGLRVIFDPSLGEESHQTRGYEFEGWLLGNLPQKVWVAARVYANRDGHLLRGILWRLEIGEEIGALPTQTSPRKVRE